VTTTRVPRRSTAGRVPGRLPSDRASVREEGSGRLHTAVDQYPGRPVPLPADDYRDAARWLRRKGHDDLIDMLGLSEVA
jgi:hypothetical protein